MFDEIEKAHREVLNLFLQIMDDGVLTDSCGRRVSFKNAYIIMTSNAGEGALGEKNMGFLKKDSAEMLSDKLLDFFSPEFINRIDSVIHFSALSRDSLVSVAEKRLTELKTRLSEIGVAMEYQRDVCKYIADKTVDKRLGARTVLRTVTSEIENLISSFMVEGELEKISFTIIDGQINALPEYKNAIQTETVTE